MPVLCMTPKSVEALEAEGKILSIIVMLHIILMHMVFNIGFPSVL